MKKCTTTREPRVLSSPSLAKKQSTLSRFFALKNDATRPPMKRASDCVADDVSITGTKRKKADKGLNESTVSKLNCFKNELSVKDAELLQSMSNDEKPAQKSSSAPKVNNFNSQQRSKSKEIVSSSAKISKSTVNLTPLEKQFVEIKEKYPDTLLFVECGYKYRFFGDDAKIAANVLNITCHEDHSFMTASVPVHRLHIHVRRLVSAGYKVGVVKQTETAALKAAGDNKNTPFTRELTSLYTRSTLVGEEFEGNNFAEKANDSSIQNNFLMCIFEDTWCAAKNNKQQQDADVSLAIMAVQPASGNIIYDVFKDNKSRQEMETRLEHICPVDLLVCDSLSSASKKCIKDWNNRCSLANVRVEEVSSEKILSYEYALATLRSFYEVHSSANGSDEAEKNTPGMHTSDLERYPKPLIVCWAVVLGYLQQFKLERVLKSTSSFSTFFKSENHMKLPGTTIRNLEIFNNQTDGRIIGSLFWVLNRTVTAFGKRRLNTWISQPLTNVRKIEERQQAVAEIAEKKFVLLENIAQLLPQLPDLEKGLCIIYHKKCSTVQFFNVVKFLSKIHTEATASRFAASEELKSSLLKDIMDKIITSLSDVDVFLEALNETAAKNSDKTSLFKDESKFPEVTKWKEKISEKRKEMQDHRKEIQKILNKSTVDYVTVSGNEYLVEVPVSKLKSVPHDWIKISSTKAVGRFRTPFVEECFKKLCEYREHMSYACQEAWLNFLSSFGLNYAKYSEAVRQLAILDCLMSLAVVAEQQGYVRPRIYEEAGHIHIRQGRHPVVDVLLSEQGQYVPNDTMLESNSQRCMIITGPNMGGKSSYVRQVALICVMAQIGSFVPAEEAELGIIDGVYTRMGGNDDIYKGRSTFMNELEEVSEILKHATPRSLVILDELGRGTSTHDGTAIAHATLSFFITEINSLTLFITHYPSLANLQTSCPKQASNFHMAFISEGQHPRTENNTEISYLPATETVTFLYRLVKGVADNSYGLNVARLAEIPSEILQNAALKSLELQKIISRRRNERQALCSIWNCSSSEIREVIQKLDIEKIMKGKHASS